MVVLVVEGLEAGWRGVEGGLSVSSASGNLHS